MSYPKTMLLAEEDSDRTFVDRPPTQSDATACFIDSTQQFGIELPFVGSGRYSSSEPRSSSPPPGSAETQNRIGGLVSLLLLHWRRAAHFAVLFALSCGIGGVAYQQFRLSGALQAGLLDLSRARAPVSARSPREAQARSPNPNEPETGFQPSAAEFTPTERRLQEARGASLLATNQLAAALEQYRELRSRFPSESTFGHVVQILTRRLRCNDRSYTPCD